MTQDQHSSDYRTMLDGFLSEGSPFRLRALKSAFDLGLRMEAAEEALTEAVYRMTLRTDLKRDIDDRIRSGALSESDASEILIDYLRKTIRNLTIDRARKKKPKPLSEMPTTATSRERDSELQIKEMVQDALLMLSEGDRTILRLAHFEAIPMKELARVLGVSLATAYRRRRNAENSLLDIVERMLNA